jgi:hypothetical protein
VVKTPPKGTPSTAKKGVVPKDAKIVKELEVVLESDDENNKYTIVEYKITKK